MRTQQSIGRRKEMIVIREATLIGRQQNSWKKQRLSVEGLVRVLSSFDPTATLRRGYAIVRQGDQIVRSPGQVSKGDSLVLQLRDGRLKAKAEGAK